MTRQTAINEAKRLLAHARAAKQQNPDVLNLPDTEVNRARYRQQSASSSWEAFVSRADLHYFVARLLFVSAVYEYGFFCAQQCVENYLKAFLRSVGEESPQSHSLTALLSKVRDNCSDQTSFLHTDEVESICDKCNPFYEFARYPVQISRPKEGKYMFASGEELILDYFVFKMREILPLPSGSWDILGPQGHFDLQLCKDYHAEFYELFKRGNLNFASP